MRTDLTEAIALHDTPELRYSRAQTLMDQVDFMAAFREFVAFVRRAHPDHRFMRCAWYCLALIMVQYPDKALPWALYETGKAAEARHRYLYGSVDENRNDTFKAEFETGRAASLRPAPDSGYEQPSREALLQHLLALSETMDSFKAAGISLDRAVPIKAECAYCSKMGTAVKLMKCARCLTVSYCS